MLPRKRLCVLLVSQNTPYHDPHRQSLRKFAQESNYAPDKVRFMYIFQERQVDFVNALTSGTLSEYIFVVNFILLLLLSVIFYQNCYKDVKFFLDFETNVNFEIKNIL